MRRHTLAVIVGLLVATVAIVIWLPAPVAFCAAVGLAVVWCRALEESEESETSTALDRRDGRRPAQDDDRVRTFESRP